MRGESPPPTVNSAAAIVKRFWWNICCQFFGVWSEGVAGPQLMRTPRDHPTVLTPRRQAPGLQRLRTSLVLSYILISAAPAGVGTARYGSGLHFPDDK